MSITNVNDTDLRGKVCLKKGEIHSLGHSEVVIPEKGGLCAVHASIVLDRLTDHYFLVTWIGEEQNEHDITTEWSYTSTKARKNSSRKVVDACMLFNEHHLLNWRLHELDGVVDHVVVVESNETHSGISKPFTLERKLSSTFSKFSSRIQYVKLTDNPTTPYDRERYGRYCIYSKGLVELDLDDRDLIVISDLDEVIDPTFLKAIQNSHLRTTLRLDSHWFNFRWDCYLGTWNNKITVSTYGDLKRQINEGWNGSREPTNTLHGVNFPIPVGWHASYFTTAKGVLCKIKSYLHAGDPREETMLQNGEEYVKQIIAENKGELYNYQPSRPFTEKLPQYHSLALDFTLISSIEIHTLYWINQTEQTREVDFIESLAKRVWPNAYVSQFLPIDEMKTVTPAPGSVFIISTSRGEQNCMDTVNAYGDLLRKWQPHILFHLSDEFGQNPKMLSYYKYASLVLRQYNHAHYNLAKYDRVHLLPLGYMKGWNMTGIVESERIYPWSHVGTPLEDLRGDRHPDRLEMHQVFTEWKSNGFQNKTRLDVPEMQDIYRKSVFVPCGRGNHSLDCLRLYEASICGSIPVVCGSEEEIQATFDGQENPPWIFVSSWKEGVTKCRALLDDPTALVAQRGELIKWWEQRTETICQLLSSARSTVKQPTDTPPILWSKGISQYADYNGSGDYWWQFTESRQNSDYFWKYFRSMSGLVWIRLGSPIKPWYDLDYFAKYVNHLQHPIVLLTTDGDASVPSSLNTKTVQAILDSPNILAWATQNWDGTPHPKLKPFPIGLDLHTPKPDFPHSCTERYAILQDTESVAEAVPDRPLRILCDVHLSAPSPNHERSRIYPILHSVKHVDFTPKRCSQREIWKRYREYPFVISTHGNGLDCHRTWELLLLGCIVITKTSSLDPLFRDLPVVIVRNWGECASPDNLRLWRDQYGPLTKHSDILEKLNPIRWIQPLRNLLPSRDDTLLPPLVGDAYVTSETFNYAYTMHYVNETEFELEVLSLTPTWTQDIHLQVRQGGKAVPMRIRAPTNPEVTTLSRLVRTPFHFTPQALPPSCSIPTTIYQTYKTGEFPPHMARNQLSWKQLNPEYQYEFYDDARAKAFLVEHFPKRVAEAFDLLIPGAYKADLWRYCILYSEGGVYADIDTACLSPLRTWLPSQVDFISVRDIPCERGMIWNGFIACTPKHPFLKAVIDRVVENIHNRWYGGEETFTTNNPYIPIPTGSLAITGPVALASSVNSVCGEPESALFPLGSSKQRTYPYYLLESREWSYIACEGRAVIRTRYEQETEDRKETGGNSYLNHWMQKQVYHVGISPIWKPLVKEHPLASLIMAVHNEWKQFHHVYCPSLVRNDTGYMLTFRTDSGYTEKGKKAHETMKRSVVSLQVSSDWEIDLSSMEIVDIKLPNKIPMDGMIRQGSFDLCGIRQFFVPFQGPEDMRLFQYRGDTYGACNIATTNRRIMVLHHFKTGKTVPLHIPTRRHTPPVEKNWVPLVHRDTLYFIYCLDPLVVLECNPRNGACTVVEGDPHQMPVTERAQLKGGTPAIEYEKGTFCCLAHRTQQVHPEQYNGLFKANTYITHGVLYRNCWVLLKTDPFRIVHVSTVRSFANRAIEYASGLCMDGDDLVISAHFDDYDGMIFRIPQAKTHFEKEMREGDNHKDNLVKYSIPITEFDVLCNAVKPNSKK